MQGVVNTAVPGFRGAEGNTVPVQHQACSLSQMELTQVQEVEVLLLSFFCISWQNKLVTPEGQTVKNNAVYLIILYTHPRERESFPEYSLAFGGVGILSHSLTYTF